MSAYFQSLVTVGKKNKYTGLISDKRWSFSWMCNLLLQSWMDSKGHDGSLCRRNFVRTMSRVEISLGYSVRPLSWGYFKGTCIFFHIEWTLVWPRRSKTSQTDKYLWATTFSHYLGQMHYRNAKIKILISNLLPSKF